MTGIKSINRSRLRPRQLLWVLLAAIMVILIYVIKPDPDSVELYYGQRVYPMVRWLFSKSIGRLPMPGLYVVVVLVLALLVFRVLLPWIKGRWNRTSLFYGAISTLSALYVLFYLLWGLNYGRPRIPERMGLEVSEIDSAALVKEFSRITELLINDLEYFPIDSSVGWREWHIRAEKQVVSEVKSALKNIGFPITATPRGRLLKPRGVLLRFNTAGIYIPYSGEGHIDAGLHPIQYPFIMAHELAHGYGVADEGDCNFLAYLACARSSDEYVRISGLLSYWRYVAWDMRRLDDGEYKKRISGLPGNFVRLLREIDQNNARYPDIFPKLRNSIYDAYLRSNGVTDGLRSYSRIVRLVVEYERSASGGDGG